MQARNLQNISRLEACLLREGFHVNVSNFKNKPTCKGQPFGALLELQDSEHLRGNTHILALRLQLLTGEPPEDPPEEPPEEPPAPDEEEPASKRARLVTFAAERGDIISEGEQKLLTLLSNNKELLDLPSSRITPLTTWRGGRVGPKA